MRKQPKVNSFSVMNLLNGVLLFSYSRGSAQISQQNLHVLCPKLIQMSPNSLFFLNCDGAAKNGKLMGVVDNSKMAYFLGFDDGFPVARLETLMLSLREAFDKIDYPMNFKQKRDFQEYFEAIAAETESQASNFPGFEKVEAEIYEINAEMQKNIDKIVVQHQDLKEIEKKTEKLALMALKFKAQATEVRIKEEGRPIGFWILMGVLTVIIFGVLIGIIVYSGEDSETGASNIVVRGFPMANSTKIQHFVAKKGVN